MKDYNGNEAELSRAREVYNKIVEKYPNSCFGYLGLSKISRINAFKYNGHYNMSIVRDQGLPMAIKALELGPSVRAVHENFAHYERIFEQHSLNQKYAKKHLYLYPESAETFFIVANFMWDQEKIEKAIDYFKEALGMAEDDKVKFKILKRLAYIHYIEYNQLEKALDFYKQALEIYDRCPATHEYIGRVYFELGDNDLATQHFEKALSIVESATGKYYKLLSLANIQEENGNIENAIDYLLQASRIRKENSALHYQIGNLYYSIKQYGKAHKQFNLVINMTPTDAHAYYYAGRTADSLGKKGLALNYYKKCIQLNDESSESDWIRENVPEMTHK